MSEGFETGEAKLFGDEFSTPEMREILSEANWIQRMLDVEAALAAATAQVGLIPATAARAIRDACDIERLDLRRVRARYEQSDHPLMAILAELEQVCPGTGEYIHWGATTQDIIDTAFVLQLRQAYRVIHRDTLALERVLIDVAERHARTVMPGRTHGQHALPTTFGFKVAVWAREMHRHVVRLEQVSRRCFVGSLAGGVGTLASLGPHAREVQQLVMAELELAMPDIAWHTARDHMAELMTLLAMIASSAAKIGRELANLTRTEFQEVEEPFPRGRVGSSTMPQKRNPTMCESVIAIASLVRGYVPAAIAGMVQEHERDVAAWKPEWYAMPNAFSLTAKALSLTLYVMRHLDVKVERMRQNLEQTGGLIFSEAVMMALAAKMGRHAAHQHVYQACMEAVETGRSFREVLSENEATAAALAAEDGRDLFDAQPYIEAAEQAVREVVAQAREGWRRYQDPGAGRASPPGSPRTTAAYEPQRG